MIGPVELWQSLWMDLPSAQCCAGKGALGLPTHWEKTTWQEVHTRHFEMTLSLAFFPRGKGDRPPPPYLQGCTLSAETNPEEKHEQQQSTSWLKDPGGGCRLGIASAGLAGTQGYGAHHQAGVMVPKGWAGRRTLFS